MEDPRARLRHVQVSPPERAQESNWRMSDAPNSMSIRLRSIMGLWVEKGKNLGLII